MFASSNVRRMAATVRNRAVDRADGNGDAIGRGQEALRMRPNPKYRKESIRPQGDGALSKSVAVWRGGDFWHFAIVGVEWPIEEIRSYPFSRATDMSIAEI